MDKPKQYCSLALAFWGATNVFQVSLAQYYVPMQPPVPRHNTMFPGAHKPSINRSPSYQPGDNTNYPTPNQPHNQSYPSKSLSTNSQQIITSPPSADKFCTQVRTSVATFLTTDAGNGMSEVSITTPNAGALIYRIPNQEVKVNSMSGLKSLCNS